jgi:adenosylcobyric acid synthase
LPALKNTRNVRAEKERSYDALADVVRQHLDMDKVRKIMGMDGK